MTDSQPVASLLTLPSLLLLLVVPLPSLCTGLPPSLGISLPHGSITYYGVNFGDPPDGREQSGGQLQDSADKRVGRSDPGFYNYNLTPNQNPGYNNNHQQRSYEPASYFTSPSTYYNSPPVNDWKPLPPSQYSSSSAESSSSYTSTLSASSRSFSPSSSSTSSSSSSSSAVLTSSYPPLSFYKPPPPITSPPSIRQSYSSPYPLTYFSSSSSSSPLSLPTAAPTTFTLTTHKPIRFVKETQTTTRSSSANSVPESAASFAGGIFSEPLNIPEFKIFNSYTTSTTIAGTSTTTTARSTTTTTTDGSLLGSFWNSWSLSETKTKKRKEKNVLDVPVADEKEEDVKTTLEEVVFPSLNITNDPQNPNLDTFWEDWNSFVDEHYDSENPNSLDPRHPRKTKTSGRNITTLIKKALSLVKKVEEINNDKKAIKETLLTDKDQPAKILIKSTDKTKVNNLRNDLKALLERQTGLLKPKKQETVRSSSLGLDALSEIRDLKTEQRFNELKSLIQNQNSLSDLIKSETSSLRSLISSDDRTSDRDDDGVTKDMIKALAKLNQISSLLLKENDKTKTSVREIPAEIKNLLQSEMDQLKLILEDQNVAVARQLQEALEDEREGRSSIGSDTEIVILKALAQFNKIAGVLLKEQEKNEKQTEAALKALPALAEFIQAETSEIKDLIDEDKNDNANVEELEGLKKTVQQSLANDKLITKAIIKLNDITQLLLKDVNFTTAAVTNKLPAALTALITSETEKIREMIDLQNVAIVDILKESESLSRAEKVIEEAQKIKSSLLSEGGGDKSEEAKGSAAERKILEVIAPLLKSSEGTLQERQEILTIIAPLLASLNDDKLEEKKEKPKPKPTPEQKILEALSPLITTNDNKEQVDEEKSEILRIISPLLTKLTKETEEKEIELEEKIKDTTSEGTNESQVALEAQLAGQKSIVNALLKLTNITRTLLEEKEERLDSEQEEQVRSSSDVVESRQYEDPDYEDDNGFDPPLDRPQTDKRPKTLIERVATGTSSNQLKGNQALFEEFVKLAIERQRWEQAKQVHGIIQSTLTTPRPLKDPFYYSEEEYDEEDFLEERKPDSREEIPPSEEIRSLRPRPDNRNSSSKKSKADKQSNKKEESQDIFEEEKQTRRPKTTQRPRRPPRTKKPRRTTTTTEDPLDLASLEEEYILDEDYYIQSEETVSAEDERPVIENIEGKNSKQSSSRPQSSRERPSLFNRPASRPESRPQPKEIITSTEEEIDLGSSEDEELLENTAEEHLSEPSPEEIIVEEPEEVVTPHVFLGNNRDRSSRPRLPLPSEEKQNNIRPRPSSFLDRLRGRGFASRNQQSSANSRESSREEKPDEEPERLTVSQEEQEQRRNLLFANRNTANRFGSAETKSIEREKDEESLIVPDSAKTESSSTSNPLEILRKLVNHVNEDEEAQNEEPADVPQARPEFVSEPLPENKLATTAATTTTTTEPTTTAQETTTTERTTTTTTTTERTTTTPEIVVITASPRFEPTPEEPEVTTRRRPNFNFSRQSRLTTAPPEESSSSDSEVATESQTVAEEEAEDPVSRITFRRRPGSRGNIPRRPSFRQSNRNRPEETTTEENPAGSSEEVRSLPEAEQETRNRVVPSTLRKIPTFRGQLPSLPRPEPPQTLEIEEVTTRVAIIEPSPAPTRPSPVFRPEKKQKTFTTPKSVQFVRPSPMFRKESERTKHENEPKEEVPDDNSAEGGQIEEGDSNSRRNSLRNLFNRNGRFGGSRRGSGTDSGRHSNTVTTSESTVEISTEDGKSSMSPLENLFLIAAEKQKKEEDLENGPNSSQSVVVVTSSSSSSSVSSSSSSTTGDRLRGVRKKKQKAGARPTTSPQLSQLSPQERLVKKVRETLNTQSGERGQTTDDLEGRGGTGGTESAEDRGSERRGPLVRKISLRKKSASRKGRLLEELVDNSKHGEEGDFEDTSTSSLKRFRVKVRRRPEVNRFPTVY